VTMNGDNCVIEITGDRSLIEKAAASLKPLGIDDMARTGIISLERQN